MTFFGINKDGLTSLSQSYCGSSLSLSLSPVQIETDHESADTNPVCMQSSGARSLSAPHFQYNMYISGAGHRRRWHVAYENIHGDDGARSSRSRCRGHTQLFICAEPHVEEEKGLQCKKILFIFAFAYANGKFFLSSVLFSFLLL